MESPLLFHTCGGGHFSNCRTVPPGGFAALAQQNIMLPSFYGMMPAVKSSE